MGNKNLTNAELLTQLAKNNPVWNYEKSVELLKLNRKFTYYRNVNSLLSVIFHQTKIRTLNSDDYIQEISNKFEQSLSKKAVNLSSQREEEDYYRLIDLIAELGSGEDSANFNLY